MFIKKLFIVGLFSLLAMNEGKAEWLQTPATTNMGGKIELVKWCDWNPNHRRCHRHRHAGPHWYHKDYHYWWKHCHGYKHRGNPSCSSFCYRNPGSCY